MSFPTKVIPLSQACKTWLSATFAPKVHYHDDRYSLLGHTHDEITSASNIGGLPDFKRSTLMYQQLDNARYRSRIIKINVPGCIFFTQNKWSQDTDHGVFVASHPGYLYRPGTETIAIRSNGSSVNMVRPNYVEQRALMGGNSVPEGDTVCMGWYTIMPGTSTYVFPTSTFGGGGWSNFRWIFVPCHCVEDTIPSSKYFTWVGTADDQILQASGVNGCAFLFDQIIRNAFNGNWRDNLSTDNAIYIPTIFVSGTRWNWNSIVNNSNDNVDHIGVRFNMFDARATGKNRRWIQANDKSNRQIYWDSAGYWALGEGNNQRYRATDSDGSRDPWNLDWYNSYDSDTRVCTLTKDIVFA